MARNGSPNYYQVLQVDPKAEPEVIRAAYLRLARKYHPDINRDPQTVDRMKEINNAYDVLSDPTKRADYARIVMVEADTAEQWHTSGAAEEAPGDTEAVVYACEVCGVQDSTLRLSAFLWVFSIVIFSWRRGAVGIWCARHRSIEAVKWTFVSLLVGPWGIPWGILWTLQALFTNVAGGQQPSEVNAALLRGIAAGSLESGNYADASVALASSLELEHDASVAQVLAAIIYEYPETALLASKAKGRLSAVSPLFLVASAAGVVPATLAGILLVAALTDSGGGTGGGGDFTLPTIPAGVLEELSAPTTGNAEDSRVEVVCGAGSVDLSQPEKEDVLNYYNFVIDRNESMLQALLTWTDKTAAIVTYEQATASPSFLTASDIYLAVLDDEILTMKGRSAPERAGDFSEAVLAYWDFERAVVTNFRNGAAFRNVDTWNKGVDLQQRFGTVDAAFDREVGAICDYLTR